ncbi:MAG: cell division protein ZapB [Candidatus Babeliaceae bacterium]|nr:cell division protein ZapB [Candidatus Babeliaceae bacterium]
MEILNVLEKKIAGLIEIIKGLRLENAALAESNAHLKDQIEKLQASLLERPEELALTKAAVDDLIKNIDFLIEHEQEQ